MKKLFDNLPFRLLLGIIIGVILGQVFPESVMKVVVTLQYIMGQLITFCVPLIIIGFIAPSITKLGKNASRLLGVAIVIAYVSSVCAALMSTGAGYALIPHLSIDTEVAGLRTLPDVVFELNIPQMCIRDRGMTLADVVKTTVFLADMNDFAEMNKVYGEYFAQPFPARSAVQVAKLPKGAPLEIECIAVK